MESLSFQSSLKPTLLFIYLPLFIYTRRIHHSEHTAYARQKEIPVGKKTAFVLVGFRSDGTGRDAPPGTSSDNAPVSARRERQVITIRHAFIEPYVYVDADLHKFT